MPSGPCPADGTSVCANHARNAATTNCVRCGLFICALCDMNVGTGSYCPSCFDRMRQEGSLAAATTKTRDYFSLARIASVAGLFFTFALLGPLFGIVAISYQKKGRDQRQKNGEERLVSFNAAIFKDQSGAVRGIFASARDITEQSRLQGQLAEERAYNRGLIEASLDGLITVDPMIAITDVNVTMCRMSGYTRDELVGQPFQHFFTDPKRAAEGVRLTLDQGTITNYELTLKQKAGSDRTCSGFPLWLKNIPTWSTAPLLASR